MKNRYIPFETFVFRSPLFPVDIMSTETGMLSDVFKESVFLASPELYEGNTSKDPKKQEKLKLSMVKYYQRAATRCTPFGLFAGCSVGQLGEMTDIRLESIEKYQRCTRLDMQFLCALIQELEQMPAIQEQLLYFPNDSLCKVGGKFRYIEYHYINTRRQHNVVSLEIDEPLEQILAVSAKGATIDELVRMLTSEHITHEDANAYIRDVIDSQVLKSELDPCVIGEDALETLIKKLSKLQNITALDSLRQIRMLLDKIDALPIGTTQPLYAEVISHIKNTGVGYDAKYLFQTDLFKPSQARIARRTTERLSDMLDFLEKISVPNDNPVLSNFIRAFQKRYEDMEVPLPDVLDSELGLGYPVSINENGDVSPLVNDLAIPSLQSYMTEIVQTPADRVLFRKYVDCIRTGQRVVQLTDEDFKGFAFSHQLPDTIAVMCSLLDDQQIYVRSIGGSCGANLLGRFCHLNNDIAGFVKEITEFERQKYPDSIVAEISHLPESRIGNIASRPALREYTLHYLSNYETTGQDISVADLMLSVRKGQLYLRSKKYDKEVLPRLSCAHNYSMSNIPIYRFVCDLQFLGKTRGLQCGWNRPVADMDYLPRIQYNDIILSRQQWKIKPEEVESFGKLSHEALTAAFQLLMQKRFIPEQVVIPDYDNELYLNLTDANSQNLLLTEITKRKGIVLEEFLFDPAKAVVRQDNHSYTNEVIFVFHK